jgi:hypothetical protein
MREGEFIQEIIEKNENVHVYPNRTDGKGSICSFKKIYIQDITQFPFNFIFYGISGETEVGEWTNIYIPEDSIIQEMKI